MSISLNRALLLSLAAALLVSLVPAGLALDRRLASDLEAKARNELHRAPMVLKDRNQGRADALMMHAQEVAGAAGLAAALTGGDAARAVSLVVPPDPVESPVLVGPDGASVAGVEPGTALVDATKDGHMPVAFVRAPDGIRVVSIAPVKEGGRWRGAAGVSRPVDATTAGVLSGLTASEVVILDRAGMVTASTATDTLNDAVASALAGLPRDTVQELATPTGAYWVVAAPLGEVGTVVFARSAARELALLPQLRRNAGLAALIALAVALLLGALVATALTRPVESLAEAADRLAAGDFHAPLQGSRVREVDRMARAFDHMRGALEDRLEELAAANRELEDRQARLRALQAEMIQRDRLVAGGRLVTELAHEIRNPVANIRNCLEVIHRGVAQDPKLLEFADLAIDELLRMHELAEQMLDLNRPLDPSAASCDAGEVAERVGTLLQAGSGGERWDVTTDIGHGVPDARMAPDTLKQIVLTLVQNAREAMPGGGSIEIRVGTREGLVDVDVLDDGPGIPEDVLPRIFDPFFTTKGDVQGVGLGLFVAEGLVRRHGGRLMAENREGGGAHFRVELPAAVSTGPAEPAEEAVEER